ncbi:MAG: nucleotidyltransferase domain-containing protein [Heliobacteriaceae bacterium]|jgi:predicted nucleotidyltransferase|nr:nucleotidyltransferase domain-containing protein [Heliobacteriaceae bacterium]
MVCVSDDELKIIIEIIKTYASDCDVLVFGSRYRGTHKNYSDLDLAFNCNKTMSINRIAELKEAFEESDLPYRVDVLDYNTVSDEFRKIIDKGNEKIFRAEACTD